MLYLVHMKLDTYIRKVLGFTRHEAGFTLVELMVVIAIIAILAGIVMSSLSTAKYRANDTKRKSDLKNLALALSQYYNDNNSYPSTGNVWWGNSTNGTLKTNYIPGLAPTYTNSASLPQDPQSADDGAWGHVYLYRSDGQSYKLLDQYPLNSSVGSTQPSDEFYDPVRSTYAWMVCSGATACSTW